MQSLLWFGGMALLFGCAGNAAQSGQLTSSIAQSNVSERRAATNSLASSSSTRQAKTPAVVATTKPNGNAASAQTPCNCLVKDCVAKDSIGEQAVLSAMRKLALANDWHSEKRYKVSFDAYEAVLAEQVGDVTDAYALAGIIALRLDRDNPDYSREAAITANFVLEQRLNGALEGSRGIEARMLKHAVKVMLDADISKDLVVAENRRLASELAERDEALQRLRELTVGR